MKHFFYFISFFLSCFKLLIIWFLAPCDFAWLKIQFLSRLRIQVVIIGLFRYYMQIFIKSVYFTIIPFCKLSPKIITCQRSTYSMEDFHLLFSFQLISKYQMKTVCNQKLLILEWMGFSLLFYCVHAATIFIVIQHYRNASK